MLWDPTLFYNSSHLKWALTEHSTPSLSKVMLFQRFEISFSKNRFNYLIRHWIGSSARKNCVLLRYSTILPLENELSLSILHHLYPKLCYFKNSGFFLQESLQLFNSSLNRKQSPKELRTSTLFYNSSPSKWVLSEHSTPSLSKVMLFQKFGIFSPRMSSII